MNPALLFALELAGAPLVVCGLPVRLTSVPDAGLSAAQVHHIRLAGLTDAHFARLFRVAKNTVFNARVGRTFKAHPTPPDTEPRVGGRLLFASRKPKR